MPNSTLEDNIMYIEIMKKGIPMGLLSEAGMPAIADPGSELIHLAHQNKIRIKNSLLIILPHSLSHYNYNFKTYLGSLSKYRLTNHFSSF